MKKLFLIILSAIFFMSCSHSKKISEENTQIKPQAEVPLAPNHIQALLEITDIEEEDTENIISARVIEVLNYGSSTDPIAEGTLIKFYSNDVLLSDINKAFSGKKSVNATLSNIQGRMNENSNTYKLFTLITINN